MLILDDYAKIRHAFFSQKKSIREITREMGFCYQTIRLALDHPEPTPYAERQSDPPKLTHALQRWIDRILEADEQAPRKQRHTAAQIFRRLQSEEGYQGGYDQVRRYVAAYREKQRETFVPLLYEPGRRMEADFGQIYVDFPQGRRLVSVLLLTWAYSDCPFAMALPTQRTEAILHGTVEGFAFFGCVPHTLWWDNPKTVAKTILEGRQRELHPRYQALASHYCFQPCFCMPRKGQEKPHVENRVKQLQRRWGAPVPKVDDFEHLNRFLRRLCEEDRQRVKMGETESIGQRFVCEQAAALALPKRSFDPCVLDTAGVDKYQTAAFDKNRYSVPRACAFRTVTVKGYIDRVEIVHDNHVVARHERSYERVPPQLDPLHYLATLGVKPACLDHSEVYRNWCLPACFPAFRTALEQKHGANQGAKQYIRVLQLLADHPLTRVQHALESVPADRVPSADRIIGLVQGLQRQALQGMEEEVSATYSSQTPAVYVSPPDLQRFDQLLSTTQTPAPQASGEANAEPDGGARDLGEGSAACDAINLTLLNGDFYGIDKTHHSLDGFTAEQSETTPPADDAPGA